MFPTTPRYGRLGLVVLLLAGIGLYLPPQGRTIEAPEVAELLAPSVAHGQGIFVDTGTHLYYRVRLSRPVSPWFAGAYFKNLHDRGVQFEQMTTSPFASSVRALGWKVALANEDSVEPYAIKYWKGLDRGSGAIPASMRWPWLYLRLPRQLLDHTYREVLVPSGDNVKATIPLPRLPGARLVGARVDERLLSVEFITTMPAPDALAFYAELASLPVPTVRQGLRLEVPERIWSVPPGAPSPIGVAVEVFNWLYTDDPLSIYSRWVLPYVAPNHVQQPERLTHLPDVTKYRVMCRYRTEQDARAAEAALLN